MAPSFKYWDDCVDPEDMEAMWRDRDVSNEWEAVGETRGKKVHLSRDPDGQSYLTQTEMREMICAIAEIESNRQPLAQRYDPKSREASVGIMQMLQPTAEWLFRELGYRAFEMEGKPNLLFRPFISVYLGAAYLKWLSNFDGTSRNEEFVVRAYYGGPKKATHKSTTGYWKHYLSVKQSLPSRSEVNLAKKYSMASDDLDHVNRASSTTAGWTYWDSKASADDMEELWKNPEVLKEWTKSGERKGRVRFSQDPEKRPYLSRVEVKAVADIIVSRHFASKGIRPALLSALAEMSSMRFLDGIGPGSGIMGIPYQTALWLNKDIGFKAYKVKAMEDLSNPFLSMYFGTAYVSWLSQYEGRERTDEFVVQAYLRGPDNVNIQETGPLWVKFQRIVPSYEDLKKMNEGNCTIL
ncbi:uncharacterized protein LOC18447898 isoform X2 [Amborella trichopoda]|uniref:uncharacterized protein LOC18447898 isoform X2 n=1 Tax=Amborella trichopoda TaxID=13333 RepID=UPI0009BFF890|nr:uncharacterized protein LOC18447898 isoform X2 [Amborella trichopoda]|eukprot:XP_020531574.1 uncharacterized protein LOC18447898 isoform X2 [Amborella trichopoda]